MACVHPSALSAAPVTALPQYRLLAGESRGHESKTPRRVLSLPVSVWRPGKRPILRGFGDPCSDTYMGVDVSVVARRPNNLDSGGAEVNGGRVCRTRRDRQGEALERSGRNGDGFTCLAAPSSADPRSWTQRGCLSRMATCAAMHLPAGGFGILNSSLVRYGPFGFLWTPGESGYPWVARLCSWPCPVNFRMQQVPVFLGLMIPVVRLQIRLPPFEFGAARAPGSSQPTLRSGLLSKRPKRPGNATAGHGA